MVQRITDLHQELRVGNPVSIQYIPANQVPNQWRMRGRGRYMMRSRRLFTPYPSNNNNNDDNNNNNNIDTNN
jgi:hypothetical protein